jgi:hypothetical protein
MTSDRTFGCALAYRCKCIVVQVTCLPHGRVAEHIRNEFPDVISSVKIVFIKSPLRVQLYREKLPNVLLRY